MYRRLLLDSLLCSCLALAACGGSDGGVPGPSFPPGDGDGDGDEDPGEEPGGDGDGPDGEFGDGDGDGDDAGGPGQDAGSLPPEPFEGEGTPWMQPAPRATCGAADKPDGETQGVNGDLRCNLEIKGQVEAPHFLSLAWHNDCAYVNGNDGTTVIHVDADGKPRVTTTLTQLGFRSNWETMKANAASGLLAGYESNGVTLTVFDVAADCKAPVYKSTLELRGSVGTSIGHSGNFSVDGTIYYASSMYTSEIFAVDLKDPTKPVVITTDFGGVSTHDLGVGKDGNRGYFTYPRLVDNMGMGALAIMDLSEIQARKPGAKAKVLKEIQWPDGNITQYAIPVSFRGKDHVVVSDELGSNACDNPEKPIWGYAHIFDISDEMNPTLVARIKTEAQDPAKCMAAGQPGPGFGVGTHYCNVDRLQDPRLLACGNWEGGLRVYDIRNPWRPKEVAYFDTASSGVPGLARILPERREIWVATVPNTFYVLKIIEGGALDQVLATP